MRKELSRSFGATLVVILTIVLTMFLIRTIGQAAVGAVAPQDVVLLLGYTALGHLPTMLALSLFVAIVVTLGRLYRDSEMAVWNACGVALARFVRPVLYTAWPVLLVIGLLVVFVWPWGNRQSADLRERYTQRADVARVAPGVFQTSRDGSRVFFVERDAGDGMNSRNVFVLANEGDTEAVVSARSGRLETRADGRWVVLERGQRNDIDAATGDRSVASFEHYEALAGERELKAVDERPPRALPTLELLRRPTLANQSELAWRFGLFLGAANLLLLAIGLAATNPRRASSWNLLFALLGFVVYYNLITLSQAWVGAGRLGMGTALAALHGGAFMSALALLWWRDHATTAGWRPRAALTARRHGA